MVPMKLKMNISNFYIKKLRLETSILLEHMSDADLVHFDDFKLEINRKMKIKISNLPCTWNFGTTLIKRVGILNTYGWLIKLLANLFKFVEYFKEF